MAELHAWTSALSVTEEDESVYLFHSLVTVTNSMIKDGSHS